VCIHTGSAAIRTDTLPKNQQGQIHIEYRGRRLSFTEIERRPSQKPSLAAKLQTDAIPSGSILKTITTGTFLLWYDTEIYYLVIFFFPRHTFPQLKIPLLYQLHSAVTIA
jgi:hypothetical protein